MSATSAEQRRAWLPPRFVIRLAWIAHRAIHRFTGGRRGLKIARPGEEGYMRLVTVGRRTGRQRAAILAYLEDGPNLVTMAMNGWADPEPAWWLNLQARPDCSCRPHGWRDASGPCACRDRRGTGAAARPLRRQRVDGCPSRDAAPVPRDDRGRARAG